MSRDDDRQAIRDMTQMPGWRMVEQNIRDRAADHKARLMQWSSSPEDVIRYRAAAEAAEDVLRYVEEAMREDDEE